MGDRPIIPLEHLTCDRFEALLGTDFAVSGVPPLRLAEVRRWGEQAPGRRAPFTLEFTAEHDGYLPQATYRLEHGELGALEIFLVPLGPGPDRRMRYEAVFS